MAMTNFRRSAMANSQQKPRGNGGGGGSWDDLMKLPQVTATPIVIINSSYIDPHPPESQIELGPDGKPLPVKTLFFKWKEHTKKSFRNGKEFFPKTPCSQGWDPYNPQPCAGCTAMDMGDKSISVSEKFSFGIVHLAPYHRHPKVDYKTGQFVMKKDNSGPVMKYTECAGRNCNFCKVKAGQPPINKPGETFPNYNPNDISTEFGHRRYIEVGKNHLANIHEWDSRVSSLCSAPIHDAKGNLVARCSQQLTRNSFNCPDCGNVVIDMASDPRSDKEIDEAVSKKYPCLTCQKSVFLKEVVSCDSCASAERQFVQLGMTDVVLWGKRQGEGTASQLALDQFQTVEEFQRSLPPHIQQMLGGKSVSDIIKELGTPVNFDQVYSPRSLEDQAKRLEINPQHMGFQQQSAYSAPGPQVMNVPQVMNAPQTAMNAPPFQPQTPPYAAYPQAPQAPGPQPFVAPVKPNFGK